MNAPVATPGTAHCQCLLSGGRHLEVRADAALDQSRTCEPVKIIRAQWPTGFDNASQAFSNYQHAIRVAIFFARISEPLEEVHFGVEHSLSVIDHAAATLSANPNQVPERVCLQAAEFCAVVADRVSRGLTAFGGSNLLVLGACTDWTAGYIQALPAPWHEASLRLLLAQPALTADTILLAESPDEVCEGLYEAIQARHPLVRMRRVQSLASLSGQVTAASALRRQSVFFPIVDHGVDEPDTLLELEVVVRKLHPGEASVVHVTGFVSSKQSTRRRIEDVLNAVRGHELRGDHWHTVVRMPNTDFQGQSYELALAVADRIARGREFTGCGRVIATGAIAAGKPSDTGNGAIHPLGMVLPVEGIDRKRLLIEREARADDTVLLPANWQGEVQFAFAEIPVGNQPQVVYVHTVVPYGEGVSLTHPQNG